METKVWLGVLLSVFLIAGCTSEQAPTPTTGNAFIGGTAGVVASFEPISIKEDNVFAIFDSEDFPLAVVLNNKGEQDVGVGNVSLTLLGPAQADFENIPQWSVRNSQVIEKVSDFNVQGGEEIVSFTPENNARYTRDVTGFVDINWNVEYTYAYQTHGIINDICFKGNPTDFKICTPKEKRTFSVSGAPLTITSVEQDTAGRGVMILRVNVENKGTGRSAIPGEDFDHRFDQIAYTVDEPEKWECKSGGRENQARLSEGKAMIICRLREALAEDDLYTRNVQLTLQYSYKELVLEKLRIKESVR